MKVPNLFTAMAVTLAATASSMPTNEVDPRDASLQSDNSPALAKRAGHCGSSTFASETSGGSPGVTDCIGLVESLSGGKTWKVGTTRIELKRNGNCRFMAVADAGGTKIGNEDVRDVVRDSIARFSGNGRIGARGEMSCAGGAQGSERVRWWIWKT